MVAFHAGDDGRVGLPELGEKTLGGGQGEGEEGGGEGFTGETAAADGGCAGEQFTRTEGVAPACCAGTEGVWRHGDHFPDGDFAFGFAFQVVEQGGGEGGVGKFVGAEGAGEGVFFEFGDEVGAPGDDARLGAAEEFIAGEGDEIHACHKGFLDGGFVSQAVGGGVEEGAGAEVFDVGEAVGVGEGREFGAGGFGVEAEDAEVGGVGGEKEGDGLLREGGFVIAEVDAVGCTDFNEFGAGLGQHVGDAEAAADFDELGAGDEDAAAFGEGGEDEQDGGGVVVDDEGGFGAGEAFEQVFGMAVAGATGAFGEVVFQVGVAERGVHGLDGRAAKGGAAQVGVEDDAGGVDDGLEGGGRPGVEEVGRADDQRFEIRGFAAEGLEAGASFIERGAEGVGGEGASEFGDEIACGR